MNLRTPKELSETIAGRIRLVRCEGGLTQCEVAQRSGMSLSSYRRFEQTGSIAFVSLLRVAQVLRVDKDFDALLEKKAYKSLDEVEQYSTSSKKGRVRTPLAKTEMERVEG
jgi:transcriptional regulator with XRE-family HTH domain